MASDLFTGLKEISELCLKKQAYGFRKILWAIIFIRKFNQIVNREYCQRRIK
jgi:hypothetical protein